MTERVAAVDVGGTAIKLGLVDREGHVGDVRHEETLPHADAAPGAIVDRIVDLVAGFVDDQPIRPPAIGLAVPGIVDAAAGTARSSVNLGWHDVPMRDLVRDRTGLPVAFAHDVDAGGIAEARLGAGRTGRCVVFVPLGTGLAASVVHRETTRTVPAFDPEIGHWSVPGIETTCRCGRTGCLETVASSRVLVSGYARATGRQLRGGEVIAAALDGDTAALALWAPAREALAWALARTAERTGADRLVIGGGLAFAGPAMIADLTTAVAERLRPGPVPRLVPAAFGDLAGCIGAGLLAWDLHDTEPAGASAPVGAPPEREVRT